MIRNLQTLSLAIGTDDPVRIVGNSRIIHYGIWQPHPADDVLAWIAVGFD
jgi:hypothetical protein